MSEAHCWNQLASPACRVRCGAALRRAPVLPVAFSPRSTKSRSGMRRPSSTEATVCLEKRTRLANSSLLRPACSRKAWTTAPNVRKLSETPGSPQLPTAAPPSVFS